VLVLICEITEDCEAPVAPPVAATIPFKMIESPEDKVNPVVPVTVVGTGLLNCRYSFLDPPDSVKEYPPLTPVSVYQTDPGDPAVNPGGYSKSSMILFIGLI
jgi:hypothetical protein